MLTTIQERKANRKTAILMIGFVCLIWMLFIAGCANPKAGQLTAMAQTEFKTYQANANNAVQHAEDERLRLELRLVQQVASATIAKHEKAPDEIAAETVGEVMQRVNAYKARLAFWRGTDNSAAMIRAALAAVTKYHDSGVTADDLVPTIDAFGIAAPLIFPHILRTESNYNAAE